MQVCDATTDYVDPDWSANIAMRIECGGKVFTHSSLVYNSQRSQTSHTGRARRRRKPEADEEEGAGTSTGQAFQV